eukprot:COSAG01_NODE_13535_length_1570_cov_496.785180_4_plen_80_part_01
MRYCATEPAESMMTSTNSTVAAVGAAAGSGWGVDSVLIFKRQLRRHYHDASEGVQESTGGRGLLHMHPFALQARHPKVF